MVQNTENQGSDPQNLIENMKRTLYVHNSSSGGGGQIGLKTSLASQPGKLGKLQVRETQSQNTRWASLEE